MYHQNYYLHYWLKNNQKCIHNIYFLFCNIDYKLIDKIFDNSNTKINKYTPGKSLIKIENSDEFKKTKSDYCVLFAWNHQKEILAKEKNYLEKNGKWIIPVPSLKVIK